MRKRVQEAAKNATEDKKLCNRTSDALDFLLCYKQLSYILEALINLGKISIILTHSSLAVLTLDVCVVWPFL